MVRRTDISFTFYPDDLQQLYPINRARIRALVEEALGGKGAELSIAYVDEEEMARLHKTFLDKEGPTDVLAFPDKDRSGKVVGEIVVCVPMAIKMVEKLGGKTTPDSGDVEGEIMLYTLHGLLHIMGYDDKREKDAKKMHLREKEILARFGHKIKGLGV
ncbi:MAG: rRNA maturation RNase YbeY [Candidatus Brocadiaceae bacterium]|nr:rRNA maturation RNase YbeY [Candidatus Brocadiaceae bacterium]